MIVITCERCPKCGRYFQKYLPDKMKDEVQKSKTCIFCGSKLGPKDIEIRF